VVSAQQKGGARWQAQPATSRKRAEMGVLLRHAAGKPGIAEASARVDACAQEAAARTCREIRCSKWGRCCGVLQSQWQVG